MNPLLEVRLYRGDFLESVHKVAFALVDHKAQVLLSRGNPAFNVYLRSAAKPFQTIPFLQSGAHQYYGTSSSDLALACASHLGAPKHLEGVTNFLKKCGLNATDLQNHEHPANNEHPYACTDANPNTEKRIAQNCSGKHTAFLATQKFLNEPLQTYLQPNGPLQTQVLKAVSDLSQVPVADLNKGLVPDGCGAPIFRMPLFNVALLYAKLGTQTEAPYAESLKQIYEAMSAHPELVRGENDFNSDLIRAFNGRLVAKLGYEGLYGVAFANGTGLAVKVLDGSLRALAPSVMWILKQLYASDDSAFQALQKWENPVVYNIHHVPVGHLLAFDCEETAL